MRKRDYIELLEGQLAEESDRADENGYACMAAQNECDRLRRQLQRIRLAHEPLHEAIFPPKIAR